MSKILVRVIRGKCQDGYHKIGDTFEIDYDDPMTPQGICLGAFGSILTDIIVLSRDGVFLGGNKNQDKDSLSKPERHSLRDREKRNILTIRVLTARAQ